MAILTATKGYDMEAYRPGGYMFGMAKVTGSTKIVVSWEGHDFTMLGKFKYSVGYGITSGTFHTFTETNKGKLQVKFSNMEVSAAEFFGRAGGAYLDTFFQTVFSGNDRMNGSAYRDVLTGLNGADRLFGNGGNDIVKGGAGIDYISGGAGNDTARGGAGNDTLLGDAGSDRLAGDEGNDVLKGGSGADRFEFKSGGGSDRINDFSLAQGDKLALGSTLDDFGATLASLVRDHARVSNGNIVLRFDDGEVLTVVGMTNINALIAKGLTTIPDDPFWG